MTSVVRRTVPVLKRAIATVMLLVMAAAVVLVMAVIGASPAEYAARATLLFGVLGAALSAPDAVMGDTSVAIDKAAWWLGTLAVASPAALLAFVGQYTPAWAILGWVGLVTGGVLIGITALFMYDPREALEYVPYGNTLSGGRWSA